MKRELLDELLAAAQGVVNDAEPQSDGLVRYGKDGLGVAEAMAELGQAHIDRLKAVIKALSAEAEHQSTLHEPGEARCWTCYNQGIDRGRELAKELLDQGAKP